MKDYFLKPSGGERAAHLEYLLKRLTDFRQAGHNHNGPVSIHITRKIIQGQLAWPLDDETHFAETCAHIQAKIDDTILGRRNRAKGWPSYHAFEDHGKPKPANSKPDVVADSAGGGGKPSALPPAFQSPVQIRAPIRPATIKAHNPPGAVTRSIPPTVGVCGTAASVLQTMSQDPNANEVAWLWHTAFETVETLAQASKPEKKTKRSLIRFLAQHAEFLSRNAAALQRSFNLKLQHWRMNGRTAACLVDGRIEANAKRRVELSPPDRDQVIAAALFKHGGDVAPAWRDCLQRGELSPEINQRYLLNPARGSHIPEAVARDVVTETKLLLPHFHGPRQAKLNGAYIERDWSGVGAGDWFSSDDATLEIYAYLPDNTLTRGQFLPLVDERSKRILDFVLIPERNYTGINVRTLFNKVCLRYGLPRCGFYLENGLWRQSQLVGGAVPIGEVQLNFAQRLGVKITHTQPGNARAKVIENVLKLFQSRLRGELGWVGRNEQVLKIERVQRAKLDVESGRKQPSEAGFLSFDQWFRRLTELCEEYNATPQESKVMGGIMSPDEAWRLLQTRNDAGEVVPLAKLPEDCRFLLATHLRRVRIGRNGIMLPKSLGRGTYRNEITGQLQGREVNIYFDLELPEMISIVNDDRRQVFTVPIAPTCPAHDATPDELAAAQASVSAHTRHARQRISQLRSEYMPPTRANIVDPSTSAVGREMKAQQEKVRTQQQTRQRAQSRKNELARKAGLNPSAAKSIRGLELINEALTDES